MRHLRYFIAVAEERHFGRAAVRLHISQPALSQQIRSLEHELGTELIDRATRPIELTAAGEVFLDESRRAVSQAARAVDQCRRAARGQVGHLSVGTTFWAYNALVPAVARSFVARAPGVALDISTQPPTAQVDALQNGRLDVCFLAFAQWLMGRRAIEVEPLLEEPMVAVVAEDHPFAAREEVSLAELAGEPLIALAHSVVPGLIGSQMRMFHERGLYPTQVQETTDPFAMFSLIGAGVGVGLHMASFSRTCYPGVAFVRVEGDCLTAALLMLWRRDDDRATLQSFLDTARATARSFQPTLLGSAALV